jgi:2-amino-4-hydroxy-6-hydroxymethyldihydropteridine diphosphokinase
MHLRFAAVRLQELLSDLRLSRLYDTAPVGVISQPRFLNAAAVGVADLPPDELLARLLAIESERGRERPFAGAPRTLDLDLILYGDRVVNEPDVTIPHPRFRERRFVLEPLVEIAPDMRDPMTGKTMRELFDALLR